jgi:2-dehydro-3-deoxyphosphogluconate aldolase/(4S)-4-hydroxy-2-oxoglutarate aldolase
MVISQTTLYLAEWSLKVEKQKTLNRISELGLVAVLRGPTPELTLEMASALIAGGVQGIEITYSTPNAEEVTRRLDQQYSGQIVLGMGTLTKPEQAEAACIAGAKFLVSPHCDKELASAMLVTGLAVMIGALTPTEVYEAYQLGSDVVKLFPGSLVGPSYIKSLHGPYPYIPLMPTGGVNLDNVGAWLKAGAFSVGAGSELCPTQWARQGLFDAITQRAREFCEAIRVARSREL